MASQNIDIILQAKDQASKAIKNVRWSLEWLKKSSKTSNDSFSRALSTVKKLAVAYGWYSLWAWIIRLWADLEQTTIAFTTMLWSAEEAQSLLEDLTDFAKKTPFELTWIRQTAKQLMAFGFSADELIPTLKSLWDVASGLSVPIEQVAYAYWQVRAANQLYGTELRQFMNAGIPILQELADMYWVTAAEAKKMVEDGVVWFKDVEQAFERMSWAWGRFENLMDAQSQSLAGMWSNLKDSVVSLWEQIWMALIPVLKELLNTYQPMIEQAAQSIAIWFENEENINSLVSTTKWFISTLSTLWDVLQFVYSVFKLLLMPFQDAANHIALLAADITILTWKIRDEMIPAIVNFAWAAKEKFIEVKTTFTQVFWQIKELWIEVFSSLKDKVTEKFQDIIDFANTAFEKVYAVWSKITWVVKKIKSAASDVWAKVWDLVGARAAWGVVAQNRPYTVGENGPELFIPKTSGMIANNHSSGDININLWGVSVSGEADENRLVEKIKQELTDAMQMYKFWIS